MKKIEVDPFDSESENRYAAFQEMREEAPVHDVAGGRRFVGRDLRRIAHRSVPGPAIR